MTTMILPPAYDRQTIEDVVVYDEGAYEAEMELRVDRGAEATIACPAPDFDDDLPF